MLVCADARLPEIGVDLAGRGARIIANPTAWVTSIPPPEGTNSQAEFLWRVRALENRVVGVAATKVGTEADTVIYAGRSQIVAADGRVRRDGLGDRARAARRRRRARRPGRERARARRSRHRPRARPASASRPALRAGFVQVAVLTHDDLLDHLDGHGVDLAVGPGGVLRHGRRRRRAFADDELLDPAGPPAAALAGAEFVVWLARRVSTPLVEEVARTRALENRVFVLLWRPAAAGGPCVVDPAGTVVARAAGPRFAVQAACLRAAAATKAMAPGTDAWDAVVALDLAQCVRPIDATRRCVRLSRFTGSTRGRKMRRFRRLRAVAAAALSVGAAPSRSRRRPRPVVSRSNGRVRRPAAGPRRRASRSR